MQPDQLYLDDLAVGASVEGPPRPLDERAFAAFAALTGDDHPIHYDADYARRSRFGARVAHGLLVSAMAALGASPLSARLHGAMIAFLGHDMRFVKPVLIGDAVRARHTVEDIRPRERDGTIRFAVTLINQRGETVAEGHHTYLLARRGVPA